MIYRLIFVASIILIVVSVCGGVFGVEGVGGVWFGGVIFYLFYIQYNSAHL